MPQVVNVAVVQMPCTSEKSENLQRAVDHIGEAAAQGAHVVCLQELFASWYPCQTEDHAQFALAESIPGPTSAALSEAARRHKIVVVGSLFERRAPGIYHNTAIVLDADGAMLGMYRKMHIPDDPHYYEKFYFTPGDLGFRSFKTRYGTLGVCVCWDQWFPEAARLTALAGAQVLFYPTAIGWQADDKALHGKTQIEAWQTMMRSHAIANGVFVAAPNRVGTEQGIEFWGHSFVVDPYGTILVEGSQDKPEIIQAACDLSLLDTARTHWPFLRDRRIDAYGGLSKRYIDQDSPITG